MLLKIHVLRVISLGLLVKVILINRCRTKVKI